MGLPKSFSPAESFSFPGEPTGCQHIHGFAGMQKEMHLLGEQLHSRGPSVLGVRFTGHPVGPKNMIRTRWEDRLLHLDNGWNLLSGIIKQTFVMGLSMGGVLASASVSNHRAAGAVSMAIPHYRKGFRLLFIRSITQIKPYLKKSPTVRHNPEAVADYLNCPAMSVRSAAKLRALLALARQLLPRVQTHALLISSIGDQSIRKEGQRAVKILAALNSQLERLVWLENSDHIIIRDPTQNKAIQAIDQFTNQIVREG